MSHGKPVLMSAILIAISAIHSTLTYFGRSIEHFFIRGAVIVEMPPAEFASRLNVGGSTFLKPPGLARCLYEGSAGTIAPRTLFVGL